MVSNIRPLKVLTVQVTKETSMEDESLNPAFAIPFEAWSKRDYDLMSAALETLRQEGLGFKVRHHGASDRMELWCEDDRRFSEIRDRLQAMGIRIVLGQAKPACRESIRGSFEHRYQSPGMHRGTFLDCLIAVEPRPDNGFSFESFVAEEKLPGKLVKALEQGMRSTLHEGPLANLPILGVKVKLIDASRRDSDSTEHQYRQRGVTILRYAMKNANPVLLEPVVRFRIVVLNGRAPATTADLRKLGVLGQEQLAGPFTSITGECRASNLIGFAPKFALDATDGETLRLELSRYEEFPIDRVREVM